MENKSVEIGKIKINGGKYHQLILSFLSDLNFEMLETAPIPTPNNEIKRIVAKVDQLEAKFKQVKTTSEKLVDATMKSLVAA